MNLGFHCAVALPVLAYSDSEPRDPNGEWSGGGDERNILHQKVSGAKGSNRGGVYKGADGKMRYAKFYSSSDQAKGEMLANTLYRDLNVNAPTGQLFQSGGKTAFASDLIDGGKTLQQAGLTPANAKEILNGFAADVLVANWDVVGLANDNILMKDGTAHRVDNGASFLYRAQGGKKPDSLLNDASEFRGFLNPTINHEYAAVAKVAGIKNAEEIPSLKSQVQNIVTLQKKFGGWSNYLSHKAPYLSAENHDKIASMLTARTQKLAAFTHVSISAYSDSEPRNDKGEWSSGGGQSKPARQMHIVPAYSLTGKDGAHDTYVGIADDTWDDWAVSPYAFRDVLNGETPTMDGYGNTITPEALAKLKQDAQAIQNAASSHAIISHNLWRGESYATDADVLNKYPKGGTFTTPTLMSAALTDKFVNDYAKSDIAEPVAVTVLLQNRHGHMGIQTAPMGTPSNEVIVPGGQKYRVASIKKTGDRSYFVNLYSTQKHTGVVRVDDQKYDRNMHAYSDAEPRDADGKWSSDGGRSTYLQHRVDTLTMYHGTSSDLKDSILKEGLIPKRAHGADMWAFKNFGYRNSRPASAFATMNLENAKRYALVASSLHNATPVIVKINVPVRSLKNFVPDEKSAAADKAFRTEKSIPPSWISGVAVGKPAPGFVSLMGGKYKNVKFGRFIKAAGVPMTRTFYFVFMADEGRGKKIKASRNDKREWTAAIAICRCGHSINKHRPPDFSCGWCADCKGFHARGVTAGGPGSGWYAEDGHVPHLLIDAKITSAKVGTKLATMGFKLVHVSDGKEVWHNPSGVQVHISKYNSPSQPNLRRYTVVTKTGTVSNGHQFSKALEAISKVSTPSATATPETQKPAEPPAAKTSTADLQPTVPSYKTETLQQAGFKVVQSAKDEKGQPVDLWKSPTSAVTVEVHEIQPNLTTYTVTDAAGHSVSGSLSSALLHDIELAEKASAPTQSGESKSSLSPSVPASVKNSALTKMGFTVSQNTTGQSGEKVDVWTNPNSKAVVHVASVEDGASSKWTIKDTNGNKLSDGSSSVTMMSAIKALDSGEPHKGEIGTTDKPSTSLYPNVFPDYMGATDDAFRSKVNDAVQTTLKSHTGDQSYQKSLMSSWETDYNNMVAAGKPANQATLAEAASGKGLYAEAAAAAGISPSQVRASQTLIKAWTEGSLGPSIRAAFQKVADNDPHADPGLVLEHAITQAKLGSDKELTLHRGLKAQHGGTGDPVGALKALQHFSTFDVSFPTRGAESWTDLTTKAKSFKGSNADSVIITTKVPIKSIVTSYKTNPESFGQFPGEHEYIVAFPDRKIKLSSDRSSIVSSAMSAMQAFTTLRHCGWGVAVHGKEILLTPPVDDGATWLHSDRTKVAAAAHRLSGRIEFQGLRISIENRKGEVRSGIDNDGKPWSIKMPFDYGYIMGTKGSDNQHVDCFIGPDAHAPFAYIVHQTKKGSSEYDEDKVMLGFASANAAKKAYQSAYVGFDFFGSMTVLPMHEFIKKVMKTGKQKRPSKIHAEATLEEMILGAGYKQRLLGAPVRSRLWTLGDNRVTLYSSGMWDTLIHGRRKRGKSDGSLRLLLERTI